VLQCLLIISASIDTFQREFSCMWCEVAAAKLGWWSLYANGWRIGVAHCC